MTNTKAFNFGTKLAAVVEKYWSMFKPKNELEAYITMLAYCLLMGVGLSMQSILIFFAGVILLLTTFFILGFSKTDDSVKKEDRTWTTGFGD